MIQNLHLSNSPLDQFEIRDLISVKANVLGNIQLSITNMGIFLALLPLLVLIEFISYLSRPVSLGLRLGANISSGHIKDVKFLSFIL